MADADPTVPQTTMSSTDSTPFQNAWQRLSNRFTCNIAVQAYANALVANNRVNDAITDNFEQIGYVFKTMTGTAW